MLCPNFFKIEAYLAMASSNLCEFNKDLLMIVFLLNSGSKRSRNLGGVRRSSDNFAELGKLMVLPPCAHL